MIIERIEYERHDPLKQFQFERVTVFVALPAWGSDEDQFSNLHDAIAQVRSVVAATFDERVAPYNQTPPTTIVEKSGSDDDDSIPF